MTIDFPELDRPDNNFFIIKDGNIRTFDFLNTRALLFAHEFAAGKKHASTKPCASAARLYNHRVNEAGEALLVEVFSDGVLVFLFIHFDFCHQRNCCAVCPTTKDYFFDQP